MRRSTVITLIVAMLCIIASVLYLRPNVLLGLLKEDDAQFVVPEKVIPQERVMSEKDVEFLLALEAANYDIMLDIITDQTVLVVDKRGNGIVHHLVLHKDVKSAYRMLNRLLEQGWVEVNALNIYGQTALHLAAGKGRIEFVPLLIQNHINVMHRDTQGKKASDYAQRGQHTHLYELLKRFE